MSVATIDPTPSPTDITDFNQVRGGPPAVHPKAEPAARIPAPAPARQTAPPPVARQTATPPEPAADPTPEPADNFQKANQMPDSVWDDLGKFASDVTGRDVSGDAAAATAKADGAEAAEPAAETAPAADTTAQPAPDDAAAVDADLERQVQAFTTLKAVRTAHKEALKRERAWKAEQAEVTRKLAEAETRLKSGDTEQAKALAAELEAARKRAEELETQVKALDYTKSSEFHEKHVKPVAKALEAAYADVREMQVTDPETGAVRAASEADFKSLLPLPLGEATKKAKEMFGDLAPLVLQHKLSLRQLELAKREAVDNASKASEESRQRRIADETRQAERIKSIFDQRSAEIEQRFPDLFKPKDGDTEGNELLTKGHQLVQLLQSSELDDEGRVKVGAEIRHRAAAFGRVVRNLRTIEAELAAAKEKLKAYERSEPREGGSPSGGPAATPADPMERSLNSLASFAKKG